MFNIELVSINIDNNDPNKYLTFIDLIMISIELIVISIDFTMINFDWIFG